MRIALYLVIATALLLQDSVSPAREDAATRPSISKSEPMPTKRGKMDFNKSAKTTFEIKSWEEKAYDESDGSPKLTRAQITKVYHGDIEAKSTLEYLMMYRSDGSASFVGFERVVGSIDGHSGSFVLQHEGSFKDGIVRVTMFVVFESGTGVLSGLRGESTYTVGHAEKHAITFDYDFK